MTDNKQKLKRVNIMLYPEQVERLDKILEKKGVSRSRYLRALIDVIVEKEEERLKNKQE